MRGTLLIYRPEAAEPEERELTAAPSLEELQVLVGGWIEAVPGLKTVTRLGKRLPCAAFCNEEGKLDGLPLNHAATAIWHAAAPAFSGVDVLMGTVAVVLGDEELLAEV